MDTSHRRSPHLFLHQPPHQGNPGGAADQDHRIDLVGTQACRLERLVHGQERSFKQSRDEPLEPVPLDLLIQMKRFLLLSRQELLLEARERLAGEPPLGRFDGDRQAGLDPRILSDVEPRRLPELAGGELQELPVEVVAPELRVSVRGQHLGNARGRLHHRDVERPAAKVVDENPAAFLRPTQPERQGGGGGFVDDPFHREPRDLPGVARRPPGGVGEVRRDRDHGAADLPAQGLLRDPLQATQDEGRDLLRRVLPLVQPHAMIGSHVPLDGTHRVIGPEHELVPRRLPHEELSVRIEPRHGGKLATPLPLEKARPPVLDDADKGVRRPQVNPDDRFHFPSPCKRRPRQDAGHCRWTYTPR